MCIRDRVRGQPTERPDVVEHRDVGALHHRLDQLAVGPLHACLLYTSDAADERSSVDLGGRRIIKKKTSKQREQTTE